MPKNSCMQWGKAMPLLSRRGLRVAAALRLSQSTADSTLLCRRHSALLPAMQTPAPALTLNWPLVKGRLWMTRGASKEPGVTGGGGGLRRGGGGLGRGGGGLAVQPPEPPSMVSVRLGVSPGVEVDTRKR